MSHTRDTSKTHNNHVIVAFVGKGEIEKLWELTSIYFKRRSKSEHWEQTSFAVLIFLNIITNTDKIG